jgi:hypothetical protein
MRLFRHLTFSNVIAVIALFVALGGAAYAGTKINGKSIVNGSIGGGKLKKGTITGNKIKDETITANKIKKGTITSAQIAPGSIDSTQININTLTTVPSAQTATTATSATTAKTAESAKTAETATKATSAVTADTAEEAESAEEAERAKVAGEAEKLGGKTATDLTLTCPAKTEFYGGMCWDQTNRPFKFWLGAVKECGEAGGRLPTISELIAYVLQEGTQVGEEVWSGDVVDASGSEEKVLTSTEGVRGEREAGSSQLGYRCVFPKDQPSA